MNEEENKAIEEFERVIDFVSCGGSVVITKNDLFYYKAIVNYCKKNNQEILKNYISKDKLREKIKDLKKDYNNDIFIGYEKITKQTIKGLEELLKEE